MPTDLTSADYFRLSRTLQKEPRPDLADVRVACLGSHSLQFVEPFLVVEGARLGMRITSYFGPFGQFEQEIGNQESGLNRFGADALVLWLRPEDVDPDASIRFHGSGGSRFRTVVAESIKRLVGCAQEFRARSKGPILVANFSPPAALPLGPFEANNRDSLTYAIWEANAQLRDAIQAVPGTVVWDYANLVAGSGRDGWTDPRLWALARIAVAGRNQPSLAAHLARTLRGALRAPAKCLVFDLDGTIWGGVIGDDGIDGIQLGDDYPGSAYKAFQRYLLGLMDRGILLAVASKNDLEVVRQAFSDHPDMLIKWTDLAAARINWQPKSANLREIARELNLGADALVFFDDNPIERAEVRSNAPEVQVIEVPGDPLLYPTTLAAAAHFDQLSLTEEDRARAVMYLDDRRRQAAAERAASPEEFLQGLGMTGRVGLAGDGTLGRIAQLIGKTNQFNLTTRRHTLAELSDMARDPRTVVAWMRLADRFGDQGLIAVGILRKDGECGLIDSFVMSCRVMNRGVEQALAAYLCEHARRLDCHTMIGEYIPTRKNAIVSGLYAALGFRQVDDAGRRFELDLRRSTVAWPGTIRREEAATPTPAAE
ncbi:MAG TPA: HAD-IIIC family phosphatase [Gemmatimonadales bacterium]|nr:HAD-IIIC family phosphatase [Gemmatimonadales bacterium]